ncbi:MAG: YiiX/YebB-like N1pC/P60 family cysteine hydrolase [Gammaproteobacteria bacterium]
MIQKLKRRVIEWLQHEQAAEEQPICDYGRLSYELRLCDVVLIEGRSHVSKIIQTITKSPWSHAVLYIGRLHDIHNPIMREKVKSHYSGILGRQLVIESILGEGTIVSPLKKYQDQHLRICRPKGLTQQDAQKVIESAIGHLGLEYDIRHNLDLMRLLIPWSALPRRWHSSIFSHHAGIPTKEICSLMISEAFNSVNFPILPIIKTDHQKGLKLYHRNPRLYTPRDFDYSPFFEIIKYPIIELSDTAIYQQLPWQNAQADEQQPSNDKAQDSE